VARLRSAGSLGLLLAVSLPAAGLAAQAVTTPPAQATSVEPLLPEGSPADPYQAALASARQEASAGRYAEAAGLLETPAATWPQDFPLQLDRAYFLLRAGNYAEAAHAYRRALALSPHSAEGQRGLDDALASRGQPDQLWLGLSAGGTSWRGNPSRGSLGSAALSLDAVLRDHWTVDATCRGFVTAVMTPGGGRAGSSDLAPEGQLSLGYAASGWSLALQGVAASRSASTGGGVSRTYAYRGTGAGLAATLRLGLEWRASAAVISWEDQSSAQLEVGTAVPIGQHLWLEGRWRGQRLDGAVSGAVLAGVAWKGPWTLSLRGEYGSQRRPWDLGERTLYGLPEELRGALRLQASVPFTSSVRGWLGADLERWRTPVTGATTIDSTATRLTAGLSFSF
jgi:hypothetical protein